MKRRIALLLVLTMLISALSGCVFGNNKADKGSNQTPTNATQGSDQADTKEKNEQANSNEATVSTGLPPMTTEPITLKYLNFDSRY